VRVEGGGTGQPREFNDMNETMAAFVPRNPDEFFYANWKHERRDRRARSKI